MRAFFRRSIGLLLLFGGLISAEEQKADLLITHARIYTVDPSHPWAEALAVRNGRILYVGDARHARPFYGKKTRRIDAGGKLVLPGFVDCHVHFIPASKSLQTIKLDDANTLAEVQKRLLSYAVRHPEKQYITGFGWKYELFGKELLPDKSMLDAVVADRPVLLQAYDGHAAWANSKALAMAGIGRQTPDPINGTILRNPASNEPTGLLKESAEMLVERLEPKASEAELEAALKAGMLHANSYGITRAHSAGWDAEFLQTYAQLEAKKQLTVRFNIALLAEPPRLQAGWLDQLELLRKQYHDAWLEVGAVKFWADGVTEAHTAAMLEPYSNDPKNFGQLNWQPEAYRAAVIEVDRRGFQVYTHAIGDRTIGMALAAYAEARQRNNRHDARPRIEHVSVPNQQEIQEFAAEGVIASMQPLHALPTEHLRQTSIANLGEKRTEHLWPWRELRASGAHLCFGSDWPVVQPDPWSAIEVLVTDETTDGKPAGGWHQAERLSLPEAIAGYTIEAAYAGFHEKDEGSIEVGKRADLIMLSQNLFTIPAHEIHKTQVLTTIVDGKIVYERGSRSDK